MRRGASDAGGFGAASFGEGSIVLETVVVESIRFEFFKARARHSGAFSALTRFKCLRFRRTTMAESVEAMVTMSAAVA